MKKKLLVLAIAGAFAAPVAMADTGNVTVYGVANMSYDSTSTGNPAGGTSYNQTKVSSAQSRIGFKGTEDLGGGTSAIWQIETAIGMDNGANTSTSTTTGSAAAQACATSTASTSATCASSAITATTTTTNTAAGWGTRNTFVGLSGSSWGTVLLGQNDSPYKSATRGMDLFADTIADNRNLMGVGVIQFDGRNANVVQYNSPNLSGFQVSLQYVAGAETATTAGTSATKGNMWSLAGTYAQGPISAAAAYESHDFGSIGSGTLGATGAAVVNQKETAYKLGGSYTMDAFTGSLIYEKTSDGFGVGGVDLLDHRSWYLGGKFNVSANDAVKLAYVNKGDVGSVSNTGAKQWSVGYDHSMSKRTTVYALYTKLTNDSGSAVGVGTGVSTGAVAAGGADADPSAFSIGLKHSF